MRSCSSVAISSPPSYPRAMALRLNCSACEDQLGIVRTSAHLTISPSPSSNTTASPFSLLVTLDELGLASLNSGVCSVADCCSCSSGVSLSTGAPMHERKGSRQSLIQSIWNSRVRGRRERGRVRSALGDQLGSLVADGTEKRSHSIHVAHINSGFKQ